MNWQPVTVPLSSLTPWERNPKRISKAHARRLLDLWERLGQFQTIAIGPGGNGKRAERRGYRHDLSRRCGHHD